jgi:hypothetical protein
LVKTAHRLDQRYDWNDSELANESPASAVYNFRRFSQLKSINYLKNFAEIMSWTDLQNILSNHPVNQ